MNERHESALRRLTIEAESLRRMISGVRDTLHIFGESDGKHSLQDYMVALDQIGEIVNPSYQLGTKWTISRTKSNG